MTQVLLVRSVRRLAIYFGALLLFVSAPAFGSGEDRLIDLMKNDPSYKVRMQAVRVLGKKTKASLTRTGVAPSASVEAIVDAAQHDENHLVRGLAVSTLGELGDERGRPALSSALSDPNDFVRSRARIALAQYEKRMRPSRSADAPSVLAVTVEPIPGVDLPSGLLEAFKSSLVDQATKNAPSRYRVETERSSGKGYRFHSGIAQRLIKNVGGQTEITLVVRITVLTSPENYLRHVVTSKAKAKSGSSDQGVLDRLEQKVLHAAVDRAVRDAVAEISRS